MVSLPGPRQASKNAQHGEVRLCQRAHRRPARHIELLGLGDNSREGRHLIQSGELLRHHRHLVLGVDVGGVRWMEAGKTLFADHGLLELFCGGSTGDHVFEIDDLAVPLALHPSNQLLGNGMVAHVPSLCLLFPPACVVPLAAPVSKASIFRAFLGVVSPATFPFLAGDLRSLPPLRNS